MRIHSIKFDLLREALRAPRNVVATAHEIVAIAAAILRLEQAGRIVDPAVRGTAQTEIARIESIRWRSPLLFASLRRSRSDCDTAVAVGILAATLQVLGPKWNWSPAWTLLRQA
jgi:hypothetical protein